MRKEDFAEVFGDISEKHIAEARRGQKHKFLSRVRIALIAALMMMLAVSAVAAAAHIRQVRIENRDTELPSYEVIADMEKQVISADALRELKVKPYQIYKANYAEAAAYLGMDLLISRQLEETVLGDGVDIQGSYGKGERPITSVTLYSRHDTGSSLSGCIDMAVYLSLGTAETYTQITQILDPTRTENDAVFSEYVSETNGISAKIAVYESLGHASAYFIANGILYRISVGEDHVDPAAYLRELLDSFE